MAITIASPFSSWPQKRPHTLMILVCYPIPSRYLTTHISSIMAELCSRTHGGFYHRNSSMTQLCPLPDNPWFIQLDCNSFLHFDERHNVAPLIQSRQVMVSKSRMSARALGTSTRILPLSPMAAMRALLNLVLLSGLTLIPMSYGLALDCISFSTSSYLCPSAGFISMASEYYPAKTSVYFGFLDLSLLLSNYVFGYSGTLLMLHFSLRTPTLYFDPKFARLSLLFFPGRAKGLPEELGVIYPATSSPSILMSDLVDQLAYWTWSTVPDSSPWVSSVEHVLRLKFCFLGVSCWQYFNILTQYYSLNIKLVSKLVWHSFA